MTLWAPEVAMWIGYAVLSLGAVSGVVIVVGWFVNFILWLVLRKYNHICNAKFIRRAIEEKRARDGKTRPA